VTAVRDFLEIPTIAVKYECNDAFYNLEEDRFIPTKSETYSVESTYFVVSPATNHILQVDETPELYLNGNGVPCIKVYESKEQPSLSIAFTNGGQLINFSNEPFEAK